MPKLEAGPQKSEGCPTARLAGGWFDMGIGGEGGGASSEGGERVRTS